MDRLERGASLACLTSAYGALSRFSAGLEDADFLTASRCDGWSVGDVLFHLLLDAQRALIAFATPAHEPADVDFVSYWAPYKPGGRDALSHARFVRVSAAAYSSTAALVRHWQDTSEAALRAAGASTAERIGTQGHVLDVPDFMATLATEATIHLLDMTHPFAEAPPPDRSALELVSRTLDGLLGVSPRVGWDEITYALKGTGRLALTAPEQRALGPNAERFPLLG
jgi:Mycothiol maleylpyruvate isomerase N-terminal domain